MTDNSQKREQKRVRIMQAALKIFSHKGYNPAALDEVAREAGIAKGTLYLYFKDKEDLFYSTLMFVIENLDARLQENVDWDRDPIETLRKLAFSILEYFSQNKDYFGIFHTMVNNNLISNFDKLFKELLKWEKKLNNSVRDVIDRGKRKGLIREDISTEHIVFSYIGMVFHHLDRMEYCFYDDEYHDVNLEASIDAIMEILFNGISAREKKR